MGGSFMGPFNTVARMLGWLVLLALIVLIVNAVGVHASAVFVHGFLVTTIGGLVTFIEAIVSVFTGG